MQLRWLLRRGIGKKESTVSGNRIHQLDYKILWFLLQTAQINGMSSILPTCQIIHDVLRSPPQMWGHVGTRDEIHLKEEMVQTSVGFCTLKPTCTIRTPQKYHQTAHRCPSLSLRVDYFGYAFRKCSTCRSEKVGPCLVYGLDMIALRSKACRRLMVERSYHRRGWASHGSESVGGFDQRDGRNEREICTCLTGTGLPGMSFQHVWLPLAHLEILQRIWRRETL